MSPRVLLPILTGLGNCVMLTPMIRTIKSEWPQAKILLFTDGRWGVQAFFGGAPEIAGLVESVPSGVDIVFVPRVSGSLRFAATARLKNLRAKIIAHRIPPWAEKSLLKNALLSALGVTLVEQAVEHESVQNLGLLAPLGVVQERWQRKSAALGEYPESSVPGDYVLVQAGASNGLLTPKRWPEEHWALLIKRLAGLGFHVVLVGDSAEKKLGERISADESRITNLCGKTGIAELIGLIRGAKLVIAADSGVGHIAGAVGARLLSLWGPTSWVRSGPSGDFVNKISLNLACSPCTGDPGQPGEAEAFVACPIGRACMEKLTPDMVMALIQEKSLLA